MQKCKMNTKYSFCTHTKCCAHLLSSPYKDVDGVLQTQKCIWTAVTKQNYLCSVVGLLLNNNITLTEYVTHKLNTI